MSAIPQEFSDLLARVTAAMRGGNLPHVVIRWETTWDGDGLTPSRRSDLHAALSEVCHHADGGLLFVLLPVVDHYDGRFARQITSAVRAFAGKALLDTAKGETLEGWAHVFDLDHVGTLAPLAAEAGETSCRTYELDTEPLARAADGAASAGDDLGHVVMPSLDRRLIGMNAAVRDGVRVVGTVAGVLAFHPQPTDHIPGARVVVDAITGAGFWGSVSQLATTTARWAAQFGFPPYAVAELVRNAWVHRDWSKAVRERPIRVTMSGRRLDVVSPGGLTPRGQPRNPVLLNLCRRAGLVHGLGTGLEDLIDDLADDGKCTVEVTELSGEVRARLMLVRPPQTSAVVAPVERKVLEPPTRVQAPVGFPTRKQTVAVAKPVAADPVEVKREVAPAGPLSSTVAPAAPPPAVQAHVPGNARDEQLLDLLRCRGEVSCKLVQEELGWTRSTTRDVLARLVGLGRLRRTAEDPRSPTQAYVMARTN